MHRRYAILVALVAILAASSIFPMGGTLLSSWAVLGWGRWLYNLPGSGKFVQVAPDVHRYWGALGWAAKPIFAAAAVMYFLSLGCTAPGCATETNLPPAAVLAACCHTALPTPQLPTPTPNLHTQPNLCPPTCRRCRAGWTCGGGRCPSCSSRSPRCSCTTPEATARCWSMLALPTAGPRATPPPWRLQ